MLCLSISELYLRYFSVTDNKIESKSQIDLGKKLDFQKDTADKFYNNLSAIFNIISEQNNKTPEKLAISVPTSWVDLSIYNLDNELSVKEKVEYFEWKNQQRFGQSVKDFTFQYYPMEMEQIPKYLIVAYPKKMKNCLIKSAYKENFTIQFIDIDIFAALRAVNYLNLANNLESFALSLSSNNVNLPVIIIEDNNIINYLELNLNNLNSPVIKNAQPISDKLLNDLISVHKDKKQVLKELSGIFTVGDENNLAIVQNNKRNKIEMIDLTDLLIKINSNNPIVEKDEILNGISDYLEVLGLFARGEKQ